MKATVVIVPYQNDIKFLNILDRVLEADGEFNVIIVDNNPDNKLSDILEDYPVKYYHNGNKGLLAGATNYGVSVTDTEYFVYVCSNHTHILDNSWLNDMIREMDVKEGDMGGTLTRHAGRKHIQGGLFIARTEILKKIPYNIDKFPFQFMDVYISDKFFEHGCNMIEIRNIKSAMGVVRKNSIGKAIHAHILR